MTNKHPNVAIAKGEDAAANLITVRDTLISYALLIRAIDRARLWHELARDGEQAAADARREVEQGRAALERAREWMREQQGRAGEK